MLSPNPGYSLDLRQRIGWLCLCLVVLWADTLWAQAPKLLWTADLGHRIQSSPVLGTDGNIYVGTDDGFVHALKADGSIAWTSRTEGAVVATPAVDSDGAIFFGSTDKLLYAVNPDGRGKWFTSLRAEIASSCAVTGAGEILVATMQGALVSFNAAGNEQWRFTINEPIVSSPAIGAEGIIYFGGQDGNLYALRSNGTLFWQQSLGERVNASPAIGPDGTVYIISVSGRLLALSPGGALLWEKSLNTAVRSSPALTPDGHVLIGSDDGKLISVSKGGDISWSVQLTDTNAPIRSTPAVTQDGTVIFGSYDGSLYAVATSNGKQLWSQKTADKISASPLILPNGTVIIGSWDGKMYAYAGSNGPATNTWSGFRGNAARNGRATLSGRPAEIRVTLSPATSPLPAGSIINVQAEALGTVEAPTAMRLLVNGRQFSRLSAPPFAWTWQETNAGAYQIVAEATFPSRPILLSSTQSLTLQPLIMSTDAVKPKLVIKAPDSNLRVMIPQLTLSGTAEDNLGISRIEFQLNNGDWRTANGTTNWTAPIALVAGENNVTVRAIDLASNSSLEEKRVFRRLVMMPVNVELSGEGSLKPDIRREELEVGSTYTVTAEAAEGWFFSGWNGSVSNENAKLTFVMQTNLVLRAEFKPNPFKVIAGEFHGLIFQTNAVSAAHCGYFTLTTSEKGAFKVRLVLGGIVHELKGQFDADGRAAAVVLDERQQPLSIQFLLNWRNTPDLITGSLSSEGQTSEILGDRRAFNGKERRTPYAGTYTATFSLPSEVKEPAGSGYALVQVSDDGRIQMKGRLSDGTGLEQNTYISPEGLWPFYLAPYGNRGLLTGWLRFGNESFADLHGKLRWIRPASGGTNAFAAGWQLSPTAIGSKYSPPARKQTALGWTEGLIGLQGDGLTDLIVFKLLFKESHEIALPTLQPEIMSLKLSSESGQFSGQFAHPDFDKPVSMEGVILQKQNRAEGFYLTPRASGSIYIGPAAAPKTE